MNYRHVYMLIIEHAKSEMKLGLRPLTQSQKSKFENQYFEFHHVLPKSLYPKWSKRKSNLVALTAREHFFCHQLLTKIFPSAQMYAALVVCYNKTGNRSSKEYARARQNLSESLIGRKLPQDWKDNVVKAIKNRPQEVWDKIHESNRGRKLTNEQKEKISKANIGKHNFHHTAETKDRIRIAMSNRVVSDETKIKDSITAKEQYLSDKDKYDKIFEQGRKRGLEVSHKNRKGKHWWNNGEKNVISDDCPGNGWVKGQLQKSASKGKRWFTNGIKNILSIECPDGYSLGFTRKKGVLPS